MAYPYVPERTPVRWPRRTLRVMQAHFVLASLLALLGTLALAVYLYNLELERIELNLGLRITRSGDLYTQDSQLQIAAMVALALISVGFLRTARLLRQRRRVGLVWARIGALPLMAAGSGGAVLWALLSGTRGGTIGAELRSMEWPVRIFALLLFAQAGLAGWYVLASFAREMLQSCRHPNPDNKPALRLVTSITVTLWLLLLPLLALTFGVLTEWVYEIPVAVPEEGELLYATTFDAFTDEWDIFPGRDAAEVVAAADLPVTLGGENGATLNGTALLLTHGTPEVGKAMWSTLNRTYGDFDLRVTTHQVSGPDNNQFGVLFHYRDDNNFYVFRISGDGYYTLDKVRDGMTEKISEWIESEAIRMGTAPNELRVVAVGERFRFFVNGEPMPLCFRGNYENSMWLEPGECLTSETAFVYEDGAFQQGRIALAAGTIDGSEVQIAFDDVVITGPVQIIMTARGS